MEQSELKGKEIELKSSTMSFSTQENESEYQVIDTEAQQLSQNPQKPNDFFQSETPSKPDEEEVLSEIDDSEIISEDEEGEIIPANMFFPQRVNILKKGQFIKFKKWGEDPEETVFAIRLFGCRVNLQRCECFQFIFLILMVTWIVLVLVGKNFTLFETNFNESKCNDCLAATQRNNRIANQKAHINHSSSKST